MPKNLVIHFIFLLAVFNSSVLKAETKFSSDSTQRNKLAIKYSPFEGLFLSEHILSLEILMKKNVSFQITGNLMDGFKSNSFKPCQECNPSVTHKGYAGMLEVRAYNIANRITLPYGFDYYVSLFSRIEENENQFIDEIHVNTPNVSYSQSKNQFSTGFHAGAQKVFDSGILIEFFLGIQIWTRTDSRVYLVEGVDDFNLYQKYNELNPHGDATYIFRGGFNVGYAF